MLKINRVMKIFPQTMTHLINELINYEAVYRTAPATPGLLIIENGYKLTCGMPAHVFNFDVG